MEEEKKEETEEEEYSVKEELKEEGVFAGKRALAGGINALAQFGRGAIQVFRKHPKVEDLEEQVEGHIEELQEQEADE